MIAPPTLAIQMAMVSASAPSGAIDQLTEMYHNHADCSDKAGFFEDRYPTKEFRINKLVAFRDYLAMTLQATSETCKTT